MGKVVGVAGCFYLEGGASGDLLFRASPAAILGWVARALIPQGRGMAKDGRRSSLWGAFHFGGSRSH